MDGSAATSCEVEIESELAPIASLCAGSVRYMEEGGRRYVFMEGLRFFARGAQRQMDALLCLNYPNGSYPTKLFLPERLDLPPRDGVTLNWNETAYILARNWFTWSWNNVQQNQEPVAILAEHLRAFQ
jgi:hypothetical protein